MKLFRALAAGAFVLASFAAAAADYPAPKEGQWTARDFRFHTGEVMRELRINYTTVGEPSGEQQELQEFLQAAPKRAM